PLRRVLERAAEHTGSLHLELHGIDLVDADHDGIASELAALQPELRTPLAERTARLERFLARRSGFTRLCDVAAALSKS
ncbi:MAG: hypothetical protein IAG13_24640, partial [Deltaproteobacteria bacterium]|nr:hypothetical protein [Nannocystaceae bacterium]